MLDANDSVGQSMLGYNLISGVKIPFSCKEVSVSDSPEIIDVKDEKEDGEF